INISTLATSEDKLGYYGRLGWRSLNRSFKITKVSATDNCKINIRPMDFQKDLVKIKNIYEEYSGRLSGTIVRDNEYYWEAWVKTEYQKCLVAEIDGKVVAYIDSARMDINLRVKEFGALPGYEVLFQAMLEASIVALGLSEVEIRYSASIPDVAPAKPIEEKGRMISLITPFYLGAKEIKTTEQLIESMHCFTFWDTDGF
ncbi:MAG: hypothetical protein H7Y18_05735, partial [Clostridiaceae bacterium]|nr:hypothetical protein [Clostridiaceae bacterium]